MPKATLALAAVTLALGLAGPADPQPLPLDAASHYSGVWLEVGRTPMGITKGCVAGTTTYERLDDRRVKVEDDCRQGGVDGKRRAIRGDMRAGQSVGELNRTPMGRHPIRLVARAQSVGRRIAERCRFERV